MVELDLAINKLSITWAAKSGILGLALGMLLTSSFYTLKNFNYYINYIGHLRVFIPISLLILVYLGQNKGIGKTIILMILLLGSHEVVFNVFFLSYFRELPLGQYALWYGYIGAESILTAMIAIFRLYRFDKYSLSAITALVLFMTFWMAIGFPVSDNIFRINNPNPAFLPNLLEFIYNCLFSVVFYLTVKF